MDNASFTVRFTKPVSPQVREAADKLGAGMAACADAMAAPDAGELFDVILTCTAAFFSIKPLTKFERRAVIERFDTCLRHQAETARKPREN